MMSPTRTHARRTTERGSDDIGMDVPPSGEPRSPSDLIPDSIRRPSSFNGISKTSSFDPRDSIYSNAGIAGGDDPNRRRSNSYSGVKSRWSDGDDKETKKPQYAQGELQGASSVPPENNEKINMTESEVLTDIGIAHSNGKEDLQNDADNEQSESEIAKKAARRRSARPPTLARSRAKRGVTDGDISRPPRPIRRSGEELKRSKTVGVPGITSSRYDKTDKASELFGYASS
eukprot:12995045-Ditylum_brightwellii.AAC.1